MNGPVRMRTWSGLLVIAAFFWAGIVSCTKREAVEWDTDMLANLLFDMAEATKQCAADTAALRQRHEALLRAYRISPAELEQLFREYEQTPERWIPILEKMNKKVPRSKVQGQPKGGSKEQAAGSRQQAVKVKE